MGVQGFWLRSATGRHWQNTFDLEQRTRILEGIYASVLEPGTAPKKRELWPDSAIKSYS